MKRATLKIAVLFLTVVFLSGCNFFHSSYTVSVGRSYKQHGIKTYAILPFKDERNHGKRKKTPNAASVMTDSFETAFLSSGFRVVERSKVRRIIKEMKFSHQGYVNERQRKKIGRLTNADAIITGMVRVFQGPEYKNRKEPDEATKCSTIGFSVTAIHVETGELLWKASITKATGLKDDFLYGCESEVYRYADKVAGKLMDEIMSKLPKPKKKDPVKEMEEETDE